MPIEPVTHLEKTIAGTVEPVTHLEHVISEYGGGGGGGGSVTVDAELSATSENPVQNKIINAALNQKGTYTKPSGGIPDSDIASAATWNAKGTYSKPSGGIPKTDLASAVQTSLRKADTALQSVPTTYRTATAQDEIDEAQNARINQKANASALAGKVSVSQGTANAGKFLIVGSDGMVAPVTMTAWQGGSY